MDWPHAPVHRFNEAGVYFITAGTSNKQHFFRKPAALDALRAALFAQAKGHDCWLQAWSLFSNHYHLVVSADEGDRVRTMLAALHKESARDLNALDDAAGRQVWFQFRDTQLTYEASWLARLKYAHENAVHHGLVRAAEQYPWCSASWFASSAKPSFVKTVRAMKIDRVSVYDEYLPDLECGDLPSRRFG